MDAAAAVRAGPRWPGSIAGRGARTRAGQPVRAIAARLEPGLVRAGAPGRGGAGGQRRCAAGGLAGLGRSLAAHGRGAGPMARAGASAADRHGRLAQPQGREQEPGVSGRLRPQGAVHRLAGRLRWRRALGARAGGGARHA
ncbi:Uncharacterised protein [Bordetella pertussis]|nr:Uncharacterised protein [Bordetella pertussis]